MLKSDKGEYLEVDGLRTFYIKMGTGYPLLLIHGTSPGAYALTSWGINIEPLAALGSGGLWHTPGAKDAYLNEEFDQGSLDAVKLGDARKFAEHFDTGRPPGGTVSGTGETRNWIAAAGVAVGIPGKVVDYIPVYASPCGMGFAYWETA